MASKQAASRRKGADAEIKALNYYRENGLDAERLRLSGRDDEGDLVVREPVSDNRTIYTVIEVKAAAKYDIPGWLRELHTERQNFINRRGLNPADVDGMLLVKPAGVGDPAKWWAITTNEETFMLGDES
jgi:Holliday junction resolvase-like predicted endonuclease